MKYQYILNNKILFETNSSGEYFDYLMSLKDTYIKDSILYNLLIQVGGYKANMATATTN